MLQKLTLAATAAAAFPGPTPGPHPGPYASDHVVPVKARKKHFFHVKKKVCGPVYRWRTVWWHGHPHKVKVKVGYKCHWRWVPVWRWH